MNSFKELFKNARKRPSYQIAKEKLETLWLKIKRRKERRIILKRLRKL